MGKGAADWIGEFRADEGSGIRPAAGVGIVTRQVEFFASLPPAMLTTNDARHNVRSHAGADFDGAARALDDHPFFVLDAVAVGNVRVNICRRLGWSLAQSLQGQLLPVQ